MKYTWEYTDIKPGASAKDCRGDVHIIVLRRAIDGNGEDHYGLLELHSGLIVMWDPSVERMAKRMTSSRMIPLSDPDDD